MVLYSYRDSYAPQVHVIHTYTMEVKTVFVTSNDQPLLTLILSHTEDPLQRQPDAALLFIIDFLVHESTSNGISYVNT